MNLLREYIREALLLKESVNPKIMSMIDELEKNGGYAEVLPDRVLLYQPTENNKQRWVAMVTFETPRSHGAGPCARADAIVDGAAARTGLGPLAYDIAIELTGGLGLMPDRFSVSKDAAAVWDQYYSNRPDVESVQTDDHQNSLTPEDVDNCEQKSAMDNEGSYHFERSPLSKKYFKKSGTPVMDELRKRGMLK